LAADPPRTGNAQQPGQIEESELIVHLFRTAFLVGFMIWSAPLLRLQGRSWHPLWVTAAIAGGFTLLVLAPTVSRLPVLLPRATRRALALFIDLCLTTHLTVALDTDRLFPIYYLLVFVGAVWFRVEGAVVTAVMALLLRVTALHIAPGEGQVPWPAIQQQLASEGAMLLLVALIAGYQIRGREKDRRRAFRLEQTLLAARQIQDQMLPDLLHPPEGYEIGARFEPAEQVGGDYYDCFPLADGRLGICVADVAGHNLPSLVVLAGFQATLHAHARRSASPASVAGTVNDVSLASLPEDSFVALFYAALRPESGELTYVNCGHTPPLLHRHARPSEAELLSTGDVVLGILEGTSFTERTTVLEPGDVLVCATDGLLEARDEAGEQFDHDVVADLVVEVGEASADEIAATLLAAVRQHAMRWGRDDATILVVKRRPIQGN
jgi:serine phosphatase RsbU (regulator of sigma subunit)